MPLKYRMKGTKRVYSHTDGRPTKIVKKVAALARKVNKLPAPELKYMDSERTADGQIGWNVNTVSDALIVPAQGDTNVSRDGSQITLNKLHIRGRINANPLQSEPFTVRIMLIQSKERYIPSSIAAVGTVTNLLQNANINDAVHSMFGFTNRIHYRVLKDFKVVVQSTGTSGGATIDQKYFQISYKFKNFNKRLRFDAGTTTAQKNQVYLVMTSTANVNYPTTEYSARTTFYDN